MVRLSNFLIEGFGRKKRDWAGGIVKGQCGKSQSKHWQKINSRRHDLGCKWVDVEDVRWLKSQGEMGDVATCWNFYPLESALFRVYGFILSSPRVISTAILRWPPLLSKFHPTFGSTTSVEVTADIWYYDSISVITIRFTNLLKYLHPLSSMAWRSSGYVLLFNRVAILTRLQENQCRAYQQSSWQWADCINSSIWGYACILNHFSSNRLKKVDRAHFTNVEPYYDSPQPIGHSQTVNS